VQAPQRGQRLRVVGAVWRPEQTRERRPQPFHTYGIVVDLAVFSTLDHRIRSRRGLIAS